MSDIDNMDKKADKRILDPCCGGKSFYFDKDDERILFCDVRKGIYQSNNGKVVNVCPKFVIDFRKMPFENGKFDLVIFDPPHLTSIGDKSWLFNRYGRLPKAWKDYLKSGFDECWRVLRPGGTLVFKWSEGNIKIGRLFDIFPDKPVMGCRNNYTTIFVVFNKSSAAIMTK